VCRIISGGDASGHNDSQRFYKATRVLINSTINSIIEVVNNNINYNAFKGEKVLPVSNTISANDLKTKGVAAIDMAVRESEEAVVTVRGKSRYVVLPIEKYNYLRECELEAAINEAKRDYEEGRYVTETVEEHLKRVTNA